MITAAEDLDDHLRDKTLDKQHPYASYHDEQQIVRPLKSFGQEGVNGGASCRRRMKQIQPKHGTNAKGRRQDPFDCQE